MDKRNSENSSYSCRRADRSPSAGQGANPSTIHPEIPDENKGGTEMEEITTIVEIADHTGHTVAQMSQRQVTDLVSDTEQWIFAGGRRVSPEQIAQADWSTVGTVSVMPRIVWG